jgi:hypothetical protein
VIQSTFCMQEKTDYLKDISEIRSIMERSSRFISLSGLSGVMAGIYALIGAYIAYQILHTGGGEVYGRSAHVISYLLIDAVIVLILAIGTGIWLTTRRAKQQNLKIWDSTARRLVINLLIPLVTGGLFSLIMLYRGYAGMVAPAMLIFYGLALINASKYTLSDVRYLGICEIILGLCASIYAGYSLLFWALGFGLLHIVYGTVMYFKYER